MLVDVSANLCFSSAYLVQSFEVPNRIKCPVRRENKRWLGQNFPSSCHCPVNVLVAPQLWGKNEKEASKEI